MTRRAIDRDDMPKLTGRRKLKALGLTQQVTAAG
jgi:hypothetical protein